MDWVLIVFVVFKVVVFGTGMFFAIKWHYDQGKKKKRQAPPVDPVVDTKPPGGGA